MKNIFSAENQKRLNKAFTVTLIIAGLQIFITWNFAFSLLRLLEYLLSPVLGYLTKRGNQKASLALLVVFVIGSVLSLTSGFMGIMRSSLQFPANLFLLALLGIAIWIGVSIWNVYFRAYKILKFVKKS